MPLDLNNNSVIKLLIKLKTQKDDLDTDKVYLAVIPKMNPTEHNTRLIRILDDKFEIYEYYYDLDGVLFNDEITILNSQITGGGKRRKTKRRYHKKK
jgi:hypothetical protein